ncbi:hypothetical protein Srubr_54750 [Streptomyces rubradiris]|uniref:Uncharacterized protein n=1 Tax=Streptomyces rubradiris TaxID=285531 RepID=A0ABQ3RII6_STRRR|nr:hypothetical protein GCM10018792_56690 [Streptomyces rubradiris]GHI55629.1 hypothetical protein Srubr_54750 [Streptomyces rubradiris]
MGASAPNNYSPESHDDTEAVMECGFQRRSRGGSQWIPRKIQPDANGFAGVRPSWGNQRDVIPGPPDGRPLRRGADLTVPLRRQAGRRCPAAARGGFTAPRGPLHRAVPTARLCRRELPWSELT